MTSATLPLDERTARRKGGGVFGRTRSTSVLRGLVLAAVAVVLCWQLTVTAGLIAAAVAALAGALLADRWSRLALRLPTVIGLAGLATLLGLWFSRLLVGSPTLASLLGPVATFYLGEAALWTACLLPGIFVLRLLAARGEAAAVIEVAVVGSALAIGFAAHREGMVHRPLAVGDWAWSRGFDPLWIFLGLGALGTFLLAALLLHEQRRRRWPLHFALLGMLAVLLFGLVRVNGLPQRDPSGALGLKGDPEEGEGDPQEKDGQPQDGKPQQQMDDLEFKDEYQRAGEQAPVAIALLLDDYSPPSGVFYFRQTAFSQWNGQRLVAATRDDVDRDVDLRFPVGTFAVAEAPPTGRGRRALMTTIGLMADHVRPFALDSPARLEPANNPDPVRFQRVYKVRSHVQVAPYDSLLGRPPGGTDWTAEMWSHYTETPSDPRYAELAAEAVQVLAPEYRHDALAQALAIKLFLDRNGTYSRKSRHADSPDPTASFLFGDLKGYCVHFAHAATYLFRSRGIAARVAAGYAVPEADRGSGSAILIKGENAHAWPEIYLEGVGWVVVDIAPEKSLDEPAQGGDPKLQQMLGEMLRQEGEDDAARDELRNAWSWQGILERLAWLLAALLAAAYTVKAYRALAPAWTRGDQLHRIAYRAALDRLAELGLARRFGESREDFGRRGAGLAPAFDHLTGHHLAWALGSRRLAPADELRGGLRRMRRELAAARPWWRRLLAWLDPLPWWRAR